MTRTIVLDSGALIAAENNEPDLTGLIKAARIRRALVLIPSGVIAETWRGDAMHPNPARIVKTADGFPALGFDDAKRIGVMLGRVSNPSAVDGSVVDVALRHAPSLIVTSDPDDMYALIRNAPRADVQIYEL
jgi:hypothetical protein